MSAGSPSELGATLRYEFDAPVVQHGPQDVDLVSADA